METAVPKIPSLLVSCIPLIAMFAIPEVLAQNMPAAPAIEHRSPEPPPPIVRFDRRRIWMTEDRRPLPGRTGRVGQ